MICGTVKQICGEETISRMISGMAKQIYGEETIFRVIYSTMAQ